MSHDIAAYITREEIKDLVLGLLGVSPNDPDESVTIGSTTFNGGPDEPVCVHRAYRAAAEQQDGDDFDPDDWPELFNVESDGDEQTVNALELYEPDEDRRVAREIVQALAERFSL